MSKNYSPAPYQCFLPIFVCNEATRGQFHQHFTSSFYTRRSQKCQKDSLVKQLFALLGSVSIKAASKQVDEIDLLEFERNLKKTLLMFINRIIQSCISLKNKCVTMGGGGCQKFRDVIYGRSLNRIIQSCINLKNKSMLQKIISAKMCKLKK